MDPNCAYDGSDNPPKRELTPKERDILCRVIRDIVFHARNHPPEYMEDETIPWGCIKFDPVPIQIGEHDFFAILQEIYRVIDPRDDWIWRQNENISRDSETEEVSTARSTK